MAENQYTNTLPLESMLMEYRLAAVLGVGGFGITYLARDTLLEKDVAIKEFFPAGDVARVDGTTVTITNTERSGDFASGLERFLKEARTLAGFKHPNIVQVNRYFKANGTGYMVMEYEHGESLKAWLAKHPQRGEAEVKALLLPILNGLARVHEAGFLHRDVKPDNIFIRHDGTPVLLDFGSARAAGGAGGQTMTAMVTPGYAPFEQYTTKSHQGPWSDIYALGGVVFFAMTGENPPDALTRVREDAVPEALARLRGRYSDAFVDAVAWALNPAEKERPQSVAEWRARIFGEEPAPAGTPVTDFVVDEAGVAEPGAQDPATARVPRTGPPAAAAPRTGPPAVTAPPTAPPAADASPASADSLSTQDISRFLEEKEKIEQALKDKFQRVRTVMFTDLKGSTAIAEKHGDMVSRQLIQSHNEIVFPAVKEFDGTLVKSIGDGTLSHFEHARDALRAAVRIQQGIDALNRSGKFTMPVLMRVGVHTGQVILEKSDIYGDVVNTASRFESSAMPGEIFFSEDTYNALEDKGEVYCRFDRQVHLKGKSEPYNGYRAFWSPDEIEIDRKGGAKAEVVVEKKKVPWLMYLGAAGILLAVIFLLASLDHLRGMGGQERRSIQHSIDAKPKQ